MIHLYVLLLVFHSNTHYMNLFSNIIKKFNQNFTVYSLYTFCIQHYRDRWNKLAKQYFNFATYVNLQKERKTIIKK